MTLFDFGARWHLSWSRVVADEDYGLIVGRWLNGRLFGRYVSLMVPAVRTKRLKRPAAVDPDPVPLSSVDPPTGD